MYKDKVKKIYNNINRIAQGGKDNVFDYYLYVDKIVKDGDYGLFLDTLSQYYEINAANMKTVNIVKKSSWPIILNNTYSYFQVGLYNLYNTNGVYQLGLNIYRSTDNLNLGEIHSNSFITDVATYSNSVTYVLNNEFAQSIKIKKTDLTVITYNPTASTILDEDDASKSYEDNLLAKYSLAINILLQ